MLPRTRDGDIEEPPLFAVFIPIRHRQHQIEHRIVGYAAGETESPPTQIVNDDIVGLQSL
jgi:hypothetical protein